MRNPFALFTCTRNPAKLQRWTGTCLTLVQNKIFLKLFWCVIKYTRIWITHEYFHTAINLCVAALVSWSFYLPTGNDFSAKLTLPDLSVLLPCLLLNFNTGFRRMYVHIETCAMYVCTCLLRLKNWGLQEALRSFWWLRIQVKIVAKHRTFWYVISKSCLLFSFC
jgi:hypothetical protein